MRIFLFLSLFVFLMMGCTPGQPTEPSQRVSLGDEQAHYTFDDPNTPWDVFSLNGEQAIFRVVDGVLQGAVIANHGYIWSLNQARFNDVAVSATVSQTKGARGNGFGVMCRADEQGNGYYFVVSSAGQFAILKAQPNVSDPVRLVDWRSDPAIFQKAESNQIKAICVGDYLAFYANGHFLAEVHDSEFSSGQLGVVLGAIDETLWVNFDDVIVNNVALLGG
ncbi:MAG: hypothetical protein ABI690_27850 [Chloroflexota bacterium]